MIDPEQAGSQLVEDAGGIQWYSPPFGANDDDQPVLDDVSALSYDTTMIALELLKQVDRDNAGADVETVVRRFRTRFASALSSNSQPEELKAKSKSGMSFSNYANRSPTHILQLSDGRIAKREQKEVVGWWGKIRFKVRLILDRYLWMPWINLGLILIVVVAVSISDLHRWNVGRLADLLHGGRSFLYYGAFVLMNFLLAVGAFVWLAELDVFQYDNAVMAVVVGMAPATFAKANFFEVWGKKIGLSKMYDQVVVFFTERVRLGQNKFVARKAEVLAFYNSYKGLQRAWRSILRETCTASKRTTLQAALEEELETMDSNYERRKCYGRWLLRVADWNKLKIEGCVPDHLDDEAIEREDSETSGVNPVKVIRDSARYCMDSRDRQEVARRMVQVHLADADEATKRHYADKLTGRESKREQVTAQIQMLHLRFNYDAEMLRMCGLLPPKTGDLHSRILAEHPGEVVRVSYYDRAPHLYIGDRYIPIEFDAATETYATYYLPFTR